jgi:hypothetical protein
MTRVWPIEIRPSTLIAVRTAQMLPWLKKLRPSTAVSTAETATTPTSTR